MRNQWFKRSLLIVVVIFLSPVSVLAQPQLYGVNALDDGLSLIDPESGEVQFIGPLSPDPDRFITPVALASNPTDNTLYAWNNSDADQVTGVLLTVDPENGQATVVNPELGPQGQLSALAISPDGRLYGLDYQLDSIDSQSGEREDIGRLGDGLRIAGADFDSRGTLYGLTFNNELVKVNLETGEAYDLLALQSDIDIGVPGSITFNPETGTLVGSAMGGERGNILFDIVPDNLPYAIISNIRELAEAAPQGMDFIDPSLAEVPFYLSLHIEDALEGVAVNKVVGDIGEGPTNYTRLEITAKLLSRSPLATNNIPVTLTVPGNVLGSPMHVWTRKSDGGELTSASYSSPDPGVFSVTADLEPTLFRPLFGKGFYYYKQIVWQFLIPASTLPQTLNVSATADVPGAADACGSGTINIVAPGTIRTLMIANRKLLYDHYSDYQVSALLQRLFTEAQGFPASHTPTGVIYYLERYDSRAYNWDNTTVDYSNDTTANITADAIDNLIEDWWNDATSYTTINFPNYTVKFPLTSPSFLLLVGNDDTIPFYRYNDPSDDEGVDSRTSCPAADGWCVDSDTNPEINATDHDYILTDNPYADLYGGTDWQTGNLELWSGRLLGDSAADMLSLLAEGVDWNNGQQGGIVMASVDGWELGLVDDDGRAGEIADLCDVSALLRAKGFAVRNDNSPAAEVQTIDVMSPFEGGNVSWNNNFRNAANNAGGMDLFFIGGHDSYDHAVIPGDDFSPDDTPGDYTRFDSDHPLVMIVGCHGGLPVPDIDVPGGVDDCLVYDTIHEGARGYIGATGFSYGSPGNLHKNTWGERLIQRFFINLLKPYGSNTMALGAALGKAKSDYVFGFGNKDYLDRKTVTEFNLYGVPWSFLYYPNAIATEAASTEILVRTLTPSLKGTLAEISAEDENLYTQTVWLDIDRYSVDEEIVEDIVYEVFSVPGSDTAISPDAPVLPFIKGYHLPLPYEAEVVKLELLESKFEDIGHYNIPIAAVEPWSEEGLTYTTKSEIDYPYPLPDDLVEYQETGAGVDFSFFPIQHNPSSKETRFYNSFQVRITYSAPLVVAVDDFKVDKVLYRPEETIRAGAEIANVGNENTSLYAVLSINDNQGETVGNSTSSPFEIPAGGTVSLGIPWGGVLPSGPYTAELKIFQGKAEMVSGASTGFAVLAGAISELVAPDPLYLGEDGRFAVSFSNYLTKPVEAEVQLTILSSIGGYRFDSIPQPLPVPAAATATAFFDWLAEAVVPGEYQVVATVTVGSQTYGPVTKSFIISAPPCLADYDDDGDVDGYDLARFSLYFKTSDLHADLNHDQLVDTADIELFSENFAREDCPVID